MHGFYVFLAKEMREIVHTWRMWVLPGIMIVVGLISPVFAELTPKLLESVAKSQPGVVFQMPDPTAQERYRGTRTHQAGVQGRDGSGESALELCAPYRVDGSRIGRLLGYDAGLLRR